MTIFEEVTENECINNIMQQSHGLFALAKFLVLNPDPPYQYSACFGYAHRMH